MTQPRFFCAGLGDITVFARLRRPAVGAHIDSFAVRPRFCCSVEVWVEVVVAGVNSRLEDYYVAVVCVVYGVLNRGYSPLPLALT